MSRSQRPTSLPRLATALAATLALSSPAVQAQVFGSLANFDAVNDTGYTAHGFEIEIEDPSYDRSKIYSVFGLDRNFGIPPTSVERYGAPTITELPGFGLRVRYAANFADGAWSVGTPTGPYPFAGDSCWPLGNPQYASGTLSCDHFGVATYGTPAKTSYSWLIDPGNTGVLTRQQAAIPVVQFAYQAPPAGEPLPAARPVVAEIEAHKAENEVFGTAYWVKVYAKHVDHNVRVEDLMHGHADVPGDAETEVEWEIFQAGEANGNKRLNQALGANDAALVLRYEFYRYLGEVGADGEALCGRRGRGRGNGGGDALPADCGGLGDYVGAQMAALNAVQPPQIAAVPEPGSYALLLAGLALIGLRLRQTRDRTRA